MRTGSSARDEPCRKVALTHCVDLSVVEYGRQGGNTKDDIGNTSGRGGGVEWVVLRDLGDKNVVSPQLVLPQA
jgi:hypothetical protein